MITKEEVLEDIKDAKTYLEYYEEAVEESERKIYKLEEELIPFLAAETKEEIPYRKVTLMMYVTEEDGAEQEEELIRVNTPFDMPLQRVLDVFVGTLKKEYEHKPLKEGK